MKGERISVIVPVYNCESYLEEAVSSVIEQTYQNLEILLIDDGSTDGSLTLCQKIAAEDERIRLFTQKKAGAAIARNKGLQEATGEYILFLDSDDLLSKYAIEILYNASRQTKALIAVCGDTCEREQLQECVEPSGDVKQMTGREFLLTQNFHQVLWAKLYQRRVWENRQIPNIPVHEDVAILYQLFYEAASVVCCEEILYFNRIREGSLSEYGKISLRQMDRIQVLEQKMDYYCEKKETELLQMAVKEYVINLLTFYDQLVRYFPELNDKRLELKKKYRAIYPKAIHYPEKRSFQLSLILAYINPGWWMKLARLKK